MSYSQSLIIILRNLRPEEAVLAAIKGNTEDDNSVLPE